MLTPFKEHLGFYQELKVNQTFNRKFRIIDEGVYYTYFVYEVMNSQK